MFSYPLSRRASRLCHSVALHGRAVRGGRALVAVSLVVAGVIAGAGAGPALGQESPERVARAAAKADYDAMVAAAAATQQRVIDLGLDQQYLDQQLDQLSSEDRALETRMEGSATMARRYLVEAYITGTDLSVEDAILRQDSAADLAYKSYLMRDHGSHAKQVLRDHLSARNELDDRLADLADRRSRTTADLEQARVDLGLDLQRLQLADARLREADRIVVNPDPQGAAVVIWNGGDPGPSPAESGNAYGPGWDGLRQCESGGNYGIVSASGAYRGAYQFDFVTWRGMGGTGDPAQASPSEQDYRAQLLYNLRGAQPWPICGRALIADPTLSKHPATAPPATLPVAPPPPPPPVPVAPTAPPPTGSPPTAPPVTAPPTTVVPPTTVATTTTSTLPQPTSTTAG